MAFRIPFMQTCAQKKFGRRKEAPSGDTVGSLNELKNLQDRFCANPFEKVEIHENGKMYSCCPGWMDLPLGNVREHGVRVLWNGEASQEFRQSILDGSFRYCRHKICPAIQNDTLPTIEEARQNPKYADILDRQAVVMEDDPTIIDFSHDRSCNLACPSCRTDKILLTDGREFNETKSLHDQLLEAYFSKPTDRTMEIKVTGSGDPFASKLYRDFLFGLDGADFPNLTVNLQTNGVMFTERNWERIHKIHANLGFILVSCDAATPETYAPIRKGGDWDLLMTNLQHLGRRRAEGRFTHFRMDFVVQADNFMEMPAYVDLAKKMGVDMVYFMLVRNWGTWPKHVYEEKCIWKQTHPRFADFMQVLADGRLGDPVVNLGNLTHYRRKALEAA